MVKMTKTEKPNDFGTHPTIYMPIDIYMYFQIKFLLILLLRKTILKVSRHSGLNNKVSGLFGNFDAIELFFRFFKNLP